MVQIQLLAFGLMPVKPCLLSNDIFFKLKREKLVKHNLNVYSLKFLTTFFSIVTCIILRLLILY